MNHVRFNGKVKATPLFRNDLSISQKMNMLVILPHPRTAIGIRNGNN